MEILNNTKKYTVEAFQKIFDFEGKASRPQYWYFALGVFAVAICFMILSAILGKIAGFLAILVLIAQIIWNLALIIPSIAIAIRRMHDIGKSGWWVLINLVPIVGPLFFIYLAVQPSKNN